MDLHLWLIYLASAAGLSLTPGPNGLLVLTHGLRFGLRGTLPTAVGGVAGFMVLVAASLAGLGGDFRFSLLVAGMVVLGAALLAFASAFGPGRKTACA